MEDDAAAPPGLVVAGLGHLSLPLTAEQGRELQKLCLPDPTTHETLQQDSESCAAWQLDPSKFQCSNPGESYEEVSLYTNCSSQNILFLDLLLQGCT